ncbi:MAG: hypothetical protein R8K20_07685, partial [Gallionellaceae bacterium]
LVIAQALFHINEEGNSPLTLKTLSGNIQAILLTILFFITTVLIFCIASENSHPERHQVVVMLLWINLMLGWLCRAIHYFRDVHKPLKVSRLPSGTTSRVYCPYLITDMQKTN